MPMMVWLIHLHLISCLLFDFINLSCHWDWNWNQNCICQKKINHNHPHCIDVVKTPIFEWYNKTFDRNTRRIVRRNGCVVIRRSMIIIILNAFIVTCFYLHICFNILNLIFFADCVFCCVIAQLFSSSTASYSFSHPFCIWCRLHFELPSCWLVSEFFFCIWVMIVLYVKI